MSGRERETNEQKIARLRRDALEKLAIGQGRLRAASGDQEKAGLALLSFHGALEDYLRAEVASRAGGAEGQDSLERDEANWVTLSEQAVRCGVLSASDRESILETNKERNRVAHGFVVNWDSGRIARYAGQVEGWMGQPSRHDKQPRPQQQPTGQQPVRQYPYYPAESTPWYRSGCVMWLAFLFLNPVWAILIWTDEHRSRGVKTAVAVYYGLALVSALAMAGGLWGAAMRQLSGNLQATSPARSALTALPTRTSEPALERVTPATSGAAQETAEPGGCALRWEPYPDSAGLAGRNRYMVWEQLVAARVQGSGMTSDEFIAQVLERNPALAEDGYVFSAERAYVLPVCR